MTPAPCSACAARGSFFLRRGSPHGQSPQRKSPARRTDNTSRYRPHYAADGNVRPLLPLLRGGRAARVFATRERIPLPGCCPGRGESLRFTVPWHIGQGTVLDQRIKSVSPSQSTVKQVSGAGSAAIMRRASSVSTFDCRKRRSGRAPYTGSYAVRMI